ncbi:unnamed protein product [Calicophoron daubneyi]|uniref:Translationally-controlled tumor protein homolog n=1 Tax=Calicophoron daubneyi TaxID=300641 RepID=A0AAV2T859_CALDB
MRVFKDVFTGDEMFTDSHMPKLVDDVIYEVDAKRITVSNKVDDRLIGANPSTEEGGDERTEDTTQTVIDLVHGSRLVQTYFDKKGFMVWLKDYVNRVKEHIAKSDPDRVGEFQKKVQAYMSQVIKDFKEYEFFLGENMHVDGCVALMRYRPDDVTPYFVFLKDGLKEEKY